MLQGAIIIRRGDYSWGGLRGGAIFFRDQRGQGQNFFPKREGGKLFALLAQFLT